MVFLIIVWVFLQIELLINLFPFRENLQIQQVSSPENAAGIFETFRPNNVFMDINMPNMDGWECSRTIQKIDPKAKIIVVSTEVCTREKLIEFGVMAYLKKPANPKAIQTLFEKIGAMLGAPV